MAIRMLVSSNDPAAVPNTRRAWSTSFRPHAWPMRMVEAMPKPNTNEVNRNITMLALEVAANAPSPRKRPTQIALTVPFSDWRIDEASVGNAKASSVLAIGPSVRFPRPGLRVPASAIRSFRHPGLDRGLPFLCPRSCKEGGSRLKAGMTAGVLPQPLQRRAEPSGLGRLRFVVGAGLFD